jgi:hypothetical protein
MLMPSIHCNRNRLQGNRMYFTPNIQQLLMLTST